MRLRITAAFLLALSIFAPLRATAQLLQKGSLVRVTIPGEKPWLGRMVRLDADSVVVGLVEGDTARWGRSHVARLEMSTPGSHVAGTTIGFIVGAGAGAMFGAALSAKQDSERLTDAGHSVSADIGSAVIFGLVGGVAGGYIGYHVTGRRWQDVQLAPTIGLLGRGLGVRVAL